MLHEVFTEMMSAVCKAVCSLNRNTVFPLNYAPMYIKCRQGIKGGGA